MLENGFFAVVERDPARPALVDPEGTTHTYGDLGDMAHRFAHGLRREGVAAGDTLAIVMPNCAELVAAYAAAVEIGLVVVLVNWHLTADEIAYILTDSEAKVVVTHPRFAEATTAACDAADVEPSRRFAQGGAAGFRALDELGAGEPATLPPDRQPGMIMFYTSGTTGRPKGVRKIVELPDAEHLQLMTGIGMVDPVPYVEGTDVVAIASGPMYHAQPIATTVRSLDQGALVVMMDRWTPERWLELVARHRVTDAGLVPTMFHRLLALPAEVREAADVSSLQRITHAGAACSVDLKRRMIEWVGPILSENYSSTEGAGTMVTSQEWLERPGTVGRPSPGVTLKILDDEGHEVPTGTPGNVYMSQAMWRFEYHRDPEKTAGNRVDGLFTVGDIGYVDAEGYLFLSDRKADVIVSGGVNIYPVDVEARLLEHPAVGDVAVVGVPNDEWGEEVRAVVEPAAGVEPTPELGEELVAWCRAGLATYKCPRQVDFIDQLGRDPNGKVRKAQVRAPYWAGRDRNI